MQNVNIDKDKHRKGTKETTLNKSKSIEVGF